MTPPGSVPCFHHDHDITPIMYQFISAVLCPQATADKNYKEHQQILPVSYPGMTVEPCPSAAEEETEAQRGAT